MPDPEAVTRRNLRHLITRRRNERIAELRDDRWPLAIYCHRESLDDLRIDGDPDEFETLDFEGLTFMRIPLHASYTDEGGPEPGVFEVVWPTDAPAGRTTEPVPGGRADE